MNFNKITFLLSIFVLLLSISAVSAEENVMELSEEINNIDGNILNEINEEKIADEKAATNANLTDTSIEINDTEMMYKDGTKLSGILVDVNGTPIANQNVTINLNGMNYTRNTDENGIFSMALNLNPSIYDVVVTYKGSDIFGNSTANIKLTILPTIVSNDLIKFFKNESQFYATFYYADGTLMSLKNVTFNINGVFYTRATNENGTARLNINLYPNEYILTAENPNDGLKMSYNITVLPTIIAPDEMSLFFKNGTRYVAQFLDGQGKPIANQLFTANVNGLLLPRVSDSEGKIYININLFPGTYVFTTSNHMGGNFSKSTIVTVLPTLIVKDASVAFNTSGGPSGRYTVQLVDGNGNPVANKEISLNINGVFYTRTTDANGTATLTINLNPGEYIVTATFGELSMSSKFTVKRIDAKISIVSNTVRSGEMYQAKLTYGDGIPVQGRIVIFFFGDDMDPYAVRSNAEGLAQIRMNVVPGTYQMVTAIQEDEFFSNIAVYNTLTVTS